MTFRPLDTHVPLSAFNYVHLALKDMTEIDLHSKKKREKVGNEQEIAQSERNPHSTNRRKGKNQNDILILILRKHIISRVRNY